MRILVFGDSITYGAWDELGGWVERIKSLAHHQTIASIDGKDKLQVLNLGIGGDTSEKILARFQQETIARQSDNWPFIFIFSYGINDERQVEGSEEVSLDQFKKNTAELIRQARGFTDKIIFLSPTPLLDPSLSFNRQQYSNERIVRYGTALQQIVQKADVSYVSLGTIFETPQPERLYSFDRLHPNSKAHELIADKVWQEIELLLKT